MGANKSVITRGGDNAVREEFAAGGAVTPGHLLQLDADGDVTVHATAGGSQEGLIALENDVRGQDIDDAYASADQAKTIWAMRGTECNMLLANGENASIGSRLESNGDGTLRVVDSDVSVADVIIDSIVGIAREAVDMSDSSAADPSARIRVTLT